MHDLVDHHGQPDLAAPPPVPRSLTWAGRWSAITALTATAWALDLLPHPFGDADAVAIGAVFNTSPPLVGTAVTLVLGLLGVLCASAMRRSRPRPAGGPSAPLVGAWVMVATLTLVMLHGALLAFLGYVPVVAVLGWFEPGLFAAFVDAATEAETVFLLSCTLGAVLWGSAALAHRRTERAACPACGRAHGWTAADEDRTRRAALRTGRIAVRVAVVGLLVYPALRLPWLFGVRVAVDTETWAQLRTEGLETGIALGTAGLVGAILIVGLVRDWGVRVPWWLPGLAGRAVPVRAAVLPAVVVAIGFVAIGRGTLLSALAGRFTVPGSNGWLHVVAFGALLPAGVALAVATAAYATRRRATCTSCGQGKPEERPSRIHERR